MTEQLEKQICDMYINGDSYDAICEALGLSNHTQVSKVVRKYNLPPPQTKKARA